MLPLALLGSGCATRRQGVAHMVIGAALVGVGAAIGASADSSDPNGEQLVAAPLVLGGAMWLVGAGLTVLAHSQDATTPAPRAATVRPPGPSRSSAAAPAP